MGTRPLPEHLAPVRRCRAANLALREKLENQGIDTALLLKNPLAIIDELAVLRLTELLVKDNQSDTDRLRTVDLAYRICADASESRIRGKHEVLEKFRRRFGQNPPAATSAPAISETTTKEPE